MSASFRALNWWRYSGTPAWTRSPHHCLAISNAPRATPVEIAATVVRAWLDCMVRKFQPLPSPCTTFAAGTRTSSKTRVVPRQAR